MHLTRRTLLKGLLSGAAALPLAQLYPARALAAGTAKRLIVFYFPDGVPAKASNRSGLWDPRMENGKLVLSELLAPLAERANDCVFLRGLNMGSTDEGSHPGGAQKLLTGADKGNHVSLDQLLANGVGSGRPYRHLYLGVMSNDANSSDMRISYPVAGTSATPEDNPRRAFSRVFNTSFTPQTPGSVPSAPAAPDLNASVIDTALADLKELQQKLGSSEKTKLALHLDALRQVEKRIKGTFEPPMSPVPEPDCDNPGAPNTDDSRLYDASHFPSLMTANIDLTVQAMACGLTQVGVIQASRHTSELIMSRFPDGETSSPQDMRSHEASHYGAQDPSVNPRLTSYIKQRRYWVSQLKYLLDQLDARPEGDGTMLDHSLVLMCTEVADGDMHTHYNMPFVLAGRAGGSLSTGRIADFEGRHHSNLLLSMARACGQKIDKFGDRSDGGLSGLFT